MKRMRCGTCDNCLSTECGKCKYCLDKPKFGGTGRLRQSCIYKKCKIMQSKGLFISIIFFLEYMYVLYIISISST